VPPAQPRTTPTERRLTDLARFGYIIGRLNQAVRREIEERIRPHSLTIPQYTALSILRDRGGLSNAQLARRTLVTPQSMNEVIAVLERDGLIRRAPDANHRRILRTTLTPKGRKVLAACDRSIEEMEELMLSELSPAERERLRDALLSCVHMLGAGLPDA
jgi:DNA-binding MarR family transcriptional regulator